MKLSSNAPFMSQVIEKEFMFTELYEKVVFSYIFARAVQLRVTLEESKDGVFLEAHPYPGIGVRMYPNEDWVKLLRLDTWEVRVHYGLETTVPKPIDILTSSEIYTPIYEESISGVVFDKANKTIYLTGDAGIDVFCERYHDKNRELSSLFEERFLINTTDAYAAAHPRQCVSVLSMFYDRLDDQSN